MARNTTTDAVRFVSQVLHHACEVEAGGDLLDLGIGPHCLDLIGSEAFESHPPHLFGRASGWMFDREFVCTESCMLTVCADTR